MKKLLFLFTLMIFAASASFAQDSTAVKRPHGKNHMGRAHHMPFKQLNLTPDQSSKIKAIQQDEKAKRQEIVKNTTLSDADKKQQLKALRETNRKAVADVLTPEQKAKLKELNKARRQHSPKNPGTSPNDSTRVNG